MPTWQELPTAQPLAQHGEIGNGRADEGRVAHSHSKPANQLSSDSQERILRRLAQHGEIGNGRSVESRGSDAISTKQDRGQTYLLRRLARDAP